MKNGTPTINIYGEIIYRLNDLIHRLDGPAVDTQDGYKEWRIKGLLHREDGPAMIFPNGNCYYFLHGKDIFCNSIEEFLKIVKYKWII
jgi:hypothetical protein